ncbi:hypothetical protein GUJ93_ZPchr0006g45999 [Zizania palustris]|uniref:Uncharacterized protein n=1 Tax=Zizania palustris TaxID=103762 RepID=A0A8J5W2W3_ZIZPA|nr:hypothetical protein GUJ93_ZPchr0006g45999 [Zizania palustris]
MHICALLLVARACPLCPPTCCCSLAPVHARLADTPHPAAVIHSSFTHVCPMVTRACLGCLCSFCNHPCFSLSVTRSYHHWPLLATQPRRPMPLSVLARPPCVSYPTTTPSKTKMTKN